MVGCNFFYALEVGGGGRVGFKGMIKAYLTGGKNGKQKFKWLTWTARGLITVSINAELDFGVLIDGNQKFVGSISLNQDKWV